MNKLEMNHLSIPRRKWAWSASLLAVACLGAASTLSVNAQKLFIETFEGLPLGPNVDEALQGDRVWTKTPPAGWTKDDSKVPGVGTARDGVTEWAGWGFADKNWWVRTAGDQRRSEWSFGQGTVMIADPDEWDDAAHDQGLYNVFVGTPDIALAGQAANSLVLTFDSSWRPEAFDDGLPNFPVSEDGSRTNNQTGVITVTFDAASPVEVVRWDSDSNSPTFKADGEFINEAVVVPLNNPAGAQKLALNFAMLYAANDWWWSVDNIAVGVPPFVTGVTADGVSFAVRITEALGKTVKDSPAATAELDGQAVAPVEITRDGARVSVRYSQAPEIFPPGSRHTVKVKFTNNEDKVIEDSVEFIAPSYTTVSATPTRVTATITDTDWLKVDESKGVSLELDGAAVTGSASRADTQVLVSYAHPQIFAAKSAHQLKVTFTTATGKSVAETVGFTTPDWTALPTGLATAAGTGTEPGLRWRTHQLGTGRDTRVAAAEQQLAGTLGTSIHDPAGQGTDGFYSISLVNFDQGPADAGRFNSAAEGALAVVDEAIPGIPGTDGTNDNVAGEALAFLEIPQAGLYTMVVNSDDGFQVSAGTANNPSAYVLGQFDAGRGAADTVFYFKVDQPGVYFFRLLWFEGGGGANVEWFTVNADGTRALVNGGQTGALKAFRKRSVPEPEIPTGPKTI
ncbi:MAG: hypothetical protein L0Z50_13860, partial [Verrucomicrobiales bacterium]|nr:hypothetical protein [Verrucomicrobiales bacterium]